MSEKKKIIAAILSLVKDRQWDQVRSELKDIHQSEVANIMHDLPANERAIVFRILPEDNAVSIFEYLDPDLQEEIVRTLGKQEVAAILNEMSPDDRTAFLGRLPDQFLRDILNLLTDEERSVASSLLGYDESSVGRLMTPYYIQVHKEWTVEKTLDHIRRYGKKAETLNTVYVVDEHFVLVDDIRIGKLLMASPETLIAELMGTKFVALVDTMDREEAVKLFRQYDRAALPVITENGVLVGIVTVDDILDVAEAEATEDFHKVAAIRPLEQGYINTGFTELFRKRVVWLLGLVVMNIFTGAALAYFEDTITAAVALVFFLPLLIASGGNAGSQASTLMVRALSVGDVKINDWGRLLFRDLVVGALLGLAMGLAVLGVGFFRNGPQVGLVVALTMVCVVMVGSAIGTLLPFFLSRLKFDPATASAPLITSLADITGVLIYFTIAGYVLEL
jgi:magnesium transporter